MPTHWKVRPYFLAGGRTKTRRPLLVDTLVSVTRYDLVFASGLSGGARALYDSARTPSSVAELAARCDLPLGVTRMVIDDLAAYDWMTVHDSKIGRDIPMLERLRDGLLRKLA
jgi:hypothetical protein